MKVMIIEDDNNKLKAISDFLDQRSGIEHCYAQTWHSGVVALCSSNFDLLLLDMSIPCYNGTPQDEGRLLPLGGRDMLFYLRRNKISIPVIIITQYESFGGTNLKELDLEFQTEFPQHYIGYVYYNITQDKWKDDLVAFLDHPWIGGS
ncbi:MAG: hypothetical protein HDR27_01305 [Lachnospiraceae bacterium]|nr:hypothetical protein [Lachnospiraceae bacterium]